jgi:hypothetical protein
VGNAPGWMQQIALGYVKHSAGDCIHLGSAAQVHEVKTRRHALSYSWTAHPAARYEKCWLSAPLRTQKANHMQPQGTNAAPQVTASPAGSPATAA